MRSQTSAWYVFSLEGCCFEACCSHCWVGRRWHRALAEVQGLRWAVAVGGAPQRCCCRSRWLQLLCANEAFSVQLPRSALHMAWSSRRRTSCPSCNHACTGCVPFPASQALQLSAELQINEVTAVELLITAAEGRGSFTAEAVGAAVVLDKEGERGRVWQWQTGTACI